MAALFRLQNRLDGSARASGTRRSKPQDVIVDSPSRPIHLPWPFFELRSGFYARVDVRLWIGKVYGMGD